MEATKHVFVGETDVDEWVIVLTGSGRLEVNGETTVELKPGVMLSLLKGAHTRWIVDEAFSEFWVYSY